MALAWVATAVLVWLWLRESWSPVYANRWVALTAVFITYALWVVWRHLPENHREGEDELLPTLGPGNALTLARMLFVAMMAGFFFSPWPDGALGWLPVLLYTAAAIADFFDGYAARVSNHATRLGARLDMTFDGVGILLVSLLAIWYGQLPWWYIFLGLARYFFVWGLALRERLGWPIHEMHHSVHRRIFAGFQMGFLSAVLWPIVPADGAALAGTIFATATALSFLRDWLVVIGWLHPETAVYRRWQSRIYLVVKWWLPPLLRLVLGGSMLVLLAQMGNPLRPFPIENLLLSWQWPGWLAAALTVLLGVIMVVATGTAVAGIGIRLSTLLLVFPLGFIVNAMGLDWLNGVVVATTITLLLLGPGYGAVLPFEEPYLERRLGAPAEAA